MKKIIIIILIIILLAAGYFGYVYLRQEKTPEPAAHIITPEIENQTASSSFKDDAYVSRHVRMGSNNFSQGILEITNIKPESFNFTIDVNNGANMGYIEGLAIIQDNVGVFIDKEDVSCELTFYLDDQKDISIEDKGCHQMYAGRNVYFDGSYLKDGKVKQMSIERFFENKNDFELFKKVVGSNIKLFDNTAQLVSGDMDGELNTKSNTFGVNGLYTILESAIMISPDGKIFAAVIDPDKDVVLYFTNVAEYKNKLPESFNEWRSGFEDKKVIFNFVEIVK